MSLAVVFECGHVARTLVVFDNNSHGEGRTALVATLLARMLLANEVAYLVAVNDVLGFLEASARPVPTWRVVLYPAPIRGVGDVFEGFVKGNGHGRGPFLRERACAFMSVFALAGSTLPCSRIVFLRAAWASIYCVESIGAIKRVGFG